MLPPPEWKCLALVKAVSSRFGVLAHVIGSMRKSKHHNLSRAGEMRPSEGLFRRLPGGRHFLVRVLV